MWHQWLQASQETNEACFTDEVWWAEVVAGYENARKAYVMMNPSLRLLALLFAAFQQSSFCLRFRPITLWRSSFYCTILVLTRHICLCRWVLKRKLVEMSICMKLCSKKIPFRQNILLCKPNTFLWTLNYILVMFYLY